MRKSYTRSSAELSKALLLFCFMSLVLTSWLNAATVGPFANVCANGSKVILSSGSPSGGTYSGPGVVGNTFDPTAVGPGTYTITYTVVVSGVTQTATATITVNPAPAQYLTITDPAKGVHMTNDPKDTLGSFVCGFDNGFFGQNYISFTKLYACGNQLMHLNVQNPVLGDSYNWQLLTTGAGSTNNVITGGGNTPDVTIQFQKNSFYPAETVFNHYWMGFNYAYQFLNVIETNSYGCSVTYPFNFFIIQSPPTSFTADTVCLGQATSFTTPSDSITSGYHWDFGDGGTSTLQNPAHIFSSPGYHTVKLITSTGGSCPLCQDTITQSVYVKSITAPSISTCNIVACPNTSVTYSTPAGCSYYNWGVTNGTIGSGQGSDEITVNWGNNSPGELSLVTSCTGTGCPPSKIEIPVLAASSVIAGPVKICKSDPSINNYSIENFPGSVYTWSVSSASATIASGQGTNQITINWQFAPLGTYQVNVNVTNAALPCQNNSVLNVQVIDRLNASGPSPVCYNSSGTYTASPAGSYNWSVMNGSISSGQGTGSVVVNWNSKKMPHSITAKPFTAGTFCNDSASVIVQVDTSAVPVDSITGPQYICAGSLNKYTAYTKSAGLNLNWTATNGTVTTTAGNTAYVTWGATGPFSVSVTQSEPAAPFCISDPVTLNVYDITKTAPVIKGLNKVCLNDTLIYSVPALKGATYTWSVTPSSAAVVLYGQGSNSVLVYFATTGAATVNVSTSICSTTITSNFAVNINPLPPVPTVSGTGVYCLGKAGPGAKPLVYTASGGYVGYKWFYDFLGYHFSGVTTQTNSTVNPGMFPFLVQVTDANGCKQWSDEINLTDNAGHAEPMSSDPVDYCMGDPIHTTFVVNGSGFGKTPFPPPPIPKYQWFRNGVPIGGDSAIYTATQTGVYTIIITDAAGCETDQIGPAIVSIVPCTGGSSPVPCPPTATVWPIIGPSPATGKDTILGYNTVPFLPVCTDPTGPVPTITANGASFVKKKQGGGGIYGKGGNMSVEEVRDTAQLVLCGDTLQLNCTVPNAAKYFWDFDGGELDPGSSDTIANPRINFNIYIGFRLITCYVVYKDGTWNKISIKVYAPLTVRINTLLEKYDCNTIFFPQFTKWTYLNDKDTNMASITAAWLWDFGDGATSTLFQPPAHTYPLTANGGIYLVKLSALDTAVQTAGVHSCYSTRDFPTVVPPPPVAKIGASAASICVNIPIDFADLSTTYYNVPYMFPSGTDGFTYTSPYYTDTLYNKRVWDFGDGYILKNDSTSKHTYTYPGTFTVTLTVTNRYGCTATATKLITIFAAPTGDAILTTGATPSCQGNPVTLSVTSASSYLWSTGATTQSIIADTTGSYFCTLTFANGCKEELDPVSIIKYPLPNTTITGGGPLCAGSTLTLNTPYAAGNTYQWYYNGSPTATTTYNFVNTAGTDSIVITNSYGCKASNIYNIPSVKTGISAVSVAGNTSICQGTSTTLTGSSSGGTAPVTYQWLLNNGPFSTAATIKFSMAGTLTFRATDADGCTSSTNPTITIYPKPVIPGFPAGCFEMCYNDTLKVTPVASVTNYQWLKNNIPISGATNPNLIVTTDGAYSLVTTSAQGCLDTTQAANVIIKPLPTVSAGPDLNMCFASGESVTLDGSGTGTYSWSPNVALTSTTIATPVANPSSNTTYILTVTGKNSCRNKDTMNVTVTCAQPVVNLSNKTVCKDSCATLTAKAAGGAAPYAYTWSTGQTGAGPYSICSVTTTTVAVTVTDNAGHTDIDTANVVILPQMTFTSAITNISCTVATGSALVTASGSVAPYTYSWTTGSTTPSIFNVGTGIYTITATDSKGCTRDTTVSITSGGGLTIASVSTASGCSASNGAIALTLSGGTSPYTYTWNNGTTSATGSISGTTGSLSALAEGSYSITVTDAGGGICTSTSIVNVANNAGQTTTLSLSSAPSCFGSSDGTATINITGGSPNYKYSWSDGTTGATGASSATAIPLSNLTAGNYTVTVTDNNSCTSTSTLQVTNPSLLVPLASQQTSATCGSSNGVAFASATGGTGSYNYTWSAPGGTAATLTGLAAASYTVTISDANGCSKTVSAIINNNPAPSITSVDSTAVLCNGQANGSAVVTASGSGTITYTWSAPGGTAATINGLSAGTYTVTVSDATGCLAIKSVTVTQPNVITAPAFTTTNSSCSASNGMAVASASGGTGALTYTWSSNASGTTATNLSAGSYVLTVTDANGCTTTASTIINNNSGPVIGNISQTDVLCNGANTGSATVTITGGSSSYTYIWSTGVTVITTANQSVINNLSAATYTVTVTDNNSCAVTSTLQITEPSAIVSTASQQTAATCGSANGVAIASATGGTGTLTYSWSAPGGTASTLSALAAGSYTVTISDANACSKTASALINNNPAPSITSIDSANVLCNGQANGSAVVAATGSGTITYTWSAPGGTAATITGLSAGSYTVTVSDATGCLAIKSVTIIQPGVINPPTFVTTKATCGNSDGSAVASASGGTGALTYKWSNAATGVTANNLAATSYTVTITDANGCSITSSTTINNIGGPVINSITSVNESCNAGTNGNATVTVTGGSGSYTYIWSSGVNTVTSSASDQINNLLSNTYTVTVMDANSCLVVTSVTITEPNAINTPSFVITNADCSTSDGAAIASTTGGTGSLAYSWSTTAIGATATNLSAGNYTVTITDGNACVKTAVATINNNGGQSITAMTQTSVLCNGGSTGGAQVAITGGSSPYTYAWSSGATVVTNSTNDPVTNLGAGTYSVTVIDANTCQVASTVVITQPAALAGTITPVNTSCGNANGSAVASSSGGTGSVTYNWSNTASGAAISGVAAGTYTLTMTDANGCSATSTTVINPSTAPSISSIAAVNELCNGANTGSATASVTGGSGPYTYNWSTSATAVTTATTQTINNLSAATYSITITDAAGCIVTSTIDVTQPAGVFINAMTPVNAKCGLGNGSVTIAATGGSGALTYSWSTGPTQPVITNLPAGTYSVMVTDANGCTTSSSTSIINTGAIVATASSTQTTIDEGNTTVILATGGTTYSWTPASSLSCNNCALPTASPTTNTTYTVYVSDIYNCKDSATITIHVKRGCQGEDSDIYIANIFSPNGDGKNDVLNLEGGGITDIYWAIYDRWGNMLFETTDQSQGWDGTKKGAAMESGTYVYYLKALCVKSNTEIKLKGNVSIVK